MLVLVPWCLRSIWNIEARPATILSVLLLLLLLLTLTTALPTTWADWLPRLQQLPLLLLPTFFYCLVILPVTVAANTCFQTGCLNCSDDLDLTLDHTVTHTDCFRSNRRLVAAGDSTIYDCPDTDAMNGWRRRATILVHACNDCARYVRIAAEARVYFRLSSLARREGRFIEIWDRIWLAQLTRMCCAVVKVGSVQLREIIT